MVFYLLIYFLYLFAQDHQLLQYFVRHCSDNMEQEVSEAFLGLLRRPLACSRLLERGAKESARGRKQGGNRGEKKRERRGACNHFLKHLMPVYQLPVYLLIGQF